MTRIICGMFDETLHADAALEDLKGEGFQRSEVDAFYVSPPGQHDMTAVGGDANSSEGSRGAGIGAGLGATIGAVVGAAAGWVVSAAGDLGLLVIPLGAGLGAYVGSFAGSMSRVRGGKRSSATVEHPVEPVHLLGQVREVACGPEQFLPTVHLTGKRILHPRYEVRLVGQVGDDRRHVTYPVQAQKRRTALEVDQHQVEDVRRMGRNHAEDQRAQEL